LESYSIDKDSVENSLFTSIIIRFFQSIIASAVALGIIKGLCVTRLWHEAYSYLPFVNDDDQLEAIKK